MKANSSLGVLALLVLSVTLTGCNRAPKILLEAPPPDNWISNFSYCFTPHPGSTIASGELAIIYYRFFSAENLWWYYPVSMRQEAHAGINAPLMAVNTSLSYICWELGLPLLQARGLQASEGVAYLDLPGEFYQAIDILVGAFPRRALEALVLTLTEFCDINEVQFQNEGKIQNFVTADWEPYDISHPLARPLPNDIQRTNIGIKTVFYWQARQEQALVPVTYSILLSNYSLETILALLGQVPRLQTNPNEVVELERFLQSPLELFGQTPSSAITLCQQGGTIQINITSSTVSQFGSDPNLLLALSALVRTFLELPQVEQVQFLVDNQAVSYSLGLFSLAEPIRTLPFINR
ncbi:MAG: GerMN domain-containing protein [Symbiobacteriaceae bacterium]|nr:GerMN domain-containing protein [Symbiobacteriaceae bacterium]